MFKYEEMDFKTLCNAEDIDPDSADALYALAQFCRTGKGVPASQEMYEKYLRSAAQAGSEAAEQELQQLNGAPAAHKTAQAPTSLTELIHSAERGGAVRKYELAIRLMAKNKRMDAAMMLEQGMDCSEDPGMKHACGLMLAFLGVGTLTPETAQWAWDHAEGNSIKTNAEEEGKEHEIRIPLEYLTRLYGTPEQARTAGLPFDAKQAAALSNANDPAVATAWMEEAADLGDTTVYNQLGYNYACGNGVPQNTAKAFYWFQKGAEAGDADSQRNLGVCYEQGNGVPADMKQAVYWYTKAADQGQAEAQNDLGICCLKGLGMEVDLPRAIALFHKAAEGGSAMAEYNLGVAYRDGSGVGVDLQQALQWFQKAADHGHEKAKAEADRLREKLAQAQKAQASAAPRASTGVRAAPRVRTAAPRVQAAAPKAQAPAQAASGASARQGKWKVPLPLLIVVIAAVIWMLSGFAEVLLPKGEKDTVSSGTQSVAAASSSTDDPNTIDPFDESFFNQEGGVELHFNGISPNGTLTIYNNLPSDNPASQIVYEADRYEGISDQENITITATLDSSEYRLETKTLVVKADVDSHYLTALDELNADAWSQIKAALDEVVLANIGTPDANGVYGPNDNRNLNELDGHSMENSTLYNLTYKSCILLNAKNPDDLGYKQPTCRLIIEYTVDYDFVPIVSRYDSYTGTGISGCIYVDNLIVDGDGNAEVDSSQFGMDNELYKDSVDFENEWVSPRVTDYTVSRMDAAQVIPQ